MKLSKAAQIFSDLLREHGDQEFVLRMDGEASQCLSMTGSVDSTSPIRLGVASTEHEDVELFNGVVNGGDSFARPVEALP
jgi:hypothetical protein